MADGVAVERGFLNRPGGVSLYYRWAVPAGHTGPVVLLVHGFAEHLDRYAHVTRQLNEAGFAVLRFDYRGHGRASGQRGHILQFDDYLSDLAGAHGLVRRRFPDAPLFLLGHSQGGLVTLLSLVEHRHRDIRGAVVTSPLLGFAVRVPKAKLIAGRALSRYVPGLAMPTGMDASLVCRDPDVVEAYRNDPLVFGTATSRWLTEVTAAMARVQGGARQIVDPVLVLQAGDDRVVSAQATAETFERIGSSDKTYREYPGLYHEVLNEQEGREITASIIAWMTQRLPSVGAPSP